MEVTMKFDFKSILCSLMISLQPAVYAFTDYRTRPLSRRLASLPDKRRLQAVPEYRTHPLSRRLVFSLPNKERLQTNAIMSVAGGFITGLFLFNKNLDDSLSLINCMRGSSYQKAWYDKPIGGGIAVSLMLFACSLLTEEEVAPNHLENCIDEEYNPEEIAAGINDADNYLNKQSRLDVLNQLKAQYPLIIQNMKNNRLAQKLQSYLASLA
jgi:hypothetical protein